MPRAVPRGSPTPLPAARSEAGPTRSRSNRAARESARAGGDVPDCAERPRRAIWGCSSRPVSPVCQCAAIAAPAAGSSGPCHGARERRSPPCAEASAGQAPHAPRASDGEPLAPLRASSGKHAPTALRSHAGAEAVFPLPCALLGLVGPLHRSVLVLLFSGGRVDCPETHERLARRQPHAMAVSGSSRSAGR
jgi:hypothetical protein